VTLLESYAKYNNTKNFISSGWINLPRLPTVYNPKSK